jgi:hypothetical protein
MTPEEKQAMVQFMGTIYGESKKNDDMLVGQSTNLQPKSNQVRQRVEEVLRTPSSSTPLPRAVEAPPLAVQAPIKSPAQAAAELAQQGVANALVPNADKSTLEEAHIQTQLVDPNQMEFDLTEPSKVDRIIELLESHNRLLVEIRDSNIKSKYNAKRAKNKKPQ